MVYGEKKSSLTAEEHTGAAGGPAPMVARDAAVGPRRYNARAPSARYERRKRRCFDKLGAEVGHGRQPAGFRQRWTPARVDGPEGLDCSLGAGHGRATDARAGQ